MVAAAGGPDIRCAAYATFGTAELSANVVEALHGRRACLMAHHGLLAMGADLVRALALAVEVESLARMYLQALALGEPALLDDAEMARVLEKFESYGPASQRP
jgi:L-fuculose-phosphate aldolase